MSVRFIILCQPRTGSHLLGNTLANHPTIHMRREILHHKQDHGLPDAGRDRLLAALENPSYAASGCHMHAYQPDPEWPEWRTFEPAWDALADDSTIKVIYLRRDDTLAQLVSWRMAEKFGWHKQPVENRPKIHINRAELMWFRRWNHKCFEQRLDRLREHEILPIVYETMCDEWSATIRTVQEFIGVDVLDLPQATRKGETRPLSEVIENWDAIRQ